LEEPPSRSILILITTAPDQILETIISRCLRLTFATQRGVQLSPENARWLAEVSELAVQTGKSLISRYRLLGLITTRLASLKEGVRKTLEARSPLNRYEDVEPGLREKWEDELDAAIEAEYRRERSELVLALQWWMRDVWLSAGGRDISLLSFAELQNATAAVAARISEAQALENLRSLERLQKLLNTNVQEGLALEVGILKLAL
jgi:DNA polymerase-3 subunit delta'